MFTHNVNLSTRTLWVDIVVVHTGEGAAVQDKHLPEKAVKSDSVVRWVRQEDCDRGEQRSETDM